MLSKLIKWWGEPPKDSSEVELPKSTQPCPQCGGPVFESPKGRGKIWCNSKCRRAAFRRRERNRLKEAPEKLTPEPSLSVRMDELEKNQVVTEKALDTIFDSLEFFYELLARQPDTAFKGSNEERETQ